MTTPRWLATLALAGLAGFATLGAQGSPTPAITVKGLMGVQDFKDCGLEKLSPEELRRLDVWVTNYTGRVIQVLSGSGPGDKSPTPTATVVESRIDGEFQGWDGETIFKLQNGQIWQQSAYAYTYHYAYAPKVTIFRSGGLQKMQVDGVRGTIYVTRLR